MSYNAIQRNDKVIQSTLITPLQVTNVQKIAPHPDL